MREEVKRDLSAAIENFERYVKAAAEKALGQKIYSVECYTEKEIAAFLDTLAGIDAWATTQDSVRGIALRVQPQKSWDTFTIRNSRPSGAKTEFEKRQEAIRSGALYPYYTLHAYVYGGAVRWACMKTIDLIALAERAPVKRNKDGETFRVVSWRDVVGKYPILIDGVRYNREESVHPHLKIGEDERRQMRQNTS